MRAIMAARTMVHGTDADSERRRDAAPLKHELRLRVRYAETDQMGVVHHANYLIYLEESRTRLMADRGCSYAELERSGWLLPVRRTELRYRAPAYYDDEIVVRTWVQRVRAASLTFASEVVRTTDGVLLASGEVELACIDAREGTRKPTVLPDSLRAKLEAG
jgi:acyl-CoA thioester hydrolase